MWPPQEEVVSVVILQLFVLKKALHALRILDVDILSQDFCIGSVSLVFPISQMQQDVGGNLLREQVESLTSSLGQTACQAILTANEFIGQLKKSDLKNSWVISPDPCRRQWGSSRGVRSTTLDRWIPWACPSRFPRPAWTPLDCCSHGRRSGTHWSELFWRWRTVACGVSLWISRGVVSSSSSNNS